MIAALGALLATQAGCRYLAIPFALWGKEPTKKIPPAYPYMNNTRVVLLVWAEMDTLFEYPEVQLELSEYCRLALEQHIGGLTVVPPRQIVDFQRRESRWDRLPAARIGKRFTADRVIKIELTQYSTREPDSPHLYRGRISAAVSVYDVAAGEDKLPVHRTTIETTYPKDSPGEWGQSDDLVRAGMMEAFAERLAGEFYEREVKISKQEE